jgi:hypothetical protein
MRRTIAALSAVAFAFALGSGASAQTANLNPVGVDPEHYQCYSIVQPAPFQPRQVRLRDQFGFRTVTVFRPHTLCTPVSKNNALLADTKSHLVCYVVTASQPVNRRVEVTNQFGRLQFNVNTANLLCVPSLKRVLPPPG